MAKIVNIQDLEEIFYSQKKVYCKESTIKFYRDTLHCFDLYCESLNITDSGEFSRDLLQNYVIYLRDKVSPGAIRTYLRALKAFCSWAIYEEYIKPFQYKIKLPRPEESIDMPLSAEEAAAIDDIIRKNCKKPDQYLLLFHLCLDCGMRSCEALHLRYSDVDFKNNIISIRNTKYNKSRVIPLPDLIRDLLPDQVSDPQKYLVNISKTTKNSFFSRLQRWTGINRIHAHLLRHTFATSYMMERGNLEYLRMYLGHTTYDITKIYCNMAYQCDITGYKIYKISDVFK